MDDMIVLQLSNSKTNVYNKNNSYNTSKTSIDLVSVQFGSGVPTEPMSIFYGHMLRKIRFFTLKENCSRLMVPFTGRRQTTATYQSMNIWLICWSDMLVCLCRENLIGIIIPKRKSNGNHYWLSLHCYIALCSKGPEDTAS